MLNYLKSVRNVIILDLSLIFSIFCAFVFWLMFLDCALLSCLVTPPTPAEAYQRLIAGVGYSLLSVILNVYPCPDEGLILGRNIELASLLKLFIEKKSALV